MFPLCPPQSLSPKPLLAEVKTHRRAHPSASWMPGPASYDSAPLTLLPHRRMTEGNQGEQDLV